MKTLLASLLATLAFSTPGYAVSFPGIEKNVMLECHAQGSDESVFVLSDAYTTKGYGALEQDPGQMYTLPGKMTRSQSNVYSIKTSAVPLPLSLTRATGWVDDTKGIYDNGSYQLDLRSRNQSDIILLDKKTGVKLSCSIEGDCC